MTSACVRSSPGLTRTVSMILRKGLLGRPIACTYGGADVMVSNMTLMQVAELVEAGGVVVTDDPAEGLADAHAAYVHPLDLLYVSPRLDLAHHEGRSAVLHECVHVLQDACGFPLRTREDLRALENFAYIVQATLDARAGLPNEQLLGQHQLAAGHPYRAYAAQIATIVEASGLRSRAKFFTARELLAVRLPEVYDAPDPPLGARLSRRLDDLRRSSTGGMHRARLRACAMPPRPR